MEKACREYRDSAKLGARLMVSSQALPGVGMKTLLLSNLLMEALNQPLPSGSVLSNSAEMPLLASAVEQMLARKNSAEVLAKIPDSSPIHKPLTRIAAARNSMQAARLTEFLASWLARRNLTRLQLDAIGLGAKLEGEGQAVRAFAHVCLFAKHAMDFRVWFLFVDQMEDLWRRDVTTALRRTRFLTDLRTLVDEALEGAPVAITLAWNTEVLISGSRVEENIEQRLQHDYLAIFSRMRDQVRISTLPEEHILPFATAYVDHAHSQFLAEKSGQREIPGYAKFTRALTGSIQLIQEAVPEYGRRPDRSLIARAWLDALRQWAERQVA